MFDGVRHTATDSASGFRAWGLQSRLFAFGWGGGCLGLRM